MSDPAECMTSGALISCHFHFSFIIFGIRSATCLTAFVASVLSSKGNGSLAKENTDSTQKQTFARARKATWFSLCSARLAPQIHEDLPYARILKSAGVWRQDNSECHDYCIDSRAPTKLRYKRSGSFRITQTHGHSPRISPLSLPFSPDGPVS